MTRRTGGPLIMGGVLSVLILTALLVALALNNRFGPDIRTEVQLAQSGQTPTIPAMTAAATGPGEETPTTPTSREPTQGKSTTVVTPRMVNSATATMTPIATAPPARMAPEQPPGPTGTATSDSIAKLPTRNEYERIYARYWRVLVEAYRTSDPKRLQQVLHGPVLDEARQDIQSARTQGRGVDLRIKSKNLSVIKADDMELVVQHRYLDSSVWVELDSGKVVPRETPPVLLEQLTFFRRVDGTWKVVAANKQTIPAGTP